VRSRISVPRTRIVQVDLGRDPPLPRRARDVWARVPTLPSLRCDTGIWAVRSVSGSRNERARLEPDAPRGAVGAARAGACLQLGQRGTVLRRGCTHLRVLALETPRIFFLPA